MAMVDESFLAEPRAMGRKSFWRALVDSPLFHNTCSYVVFCWMQRRENVGIRDCKDVKM